MNELKLTRNELNILIYALNRMTFNEELQFERQGVSVPQTYSKIYTVWEQLHNNKKTVDLVAMDAQ
jgi:hypothetical protein